MDKLATNLGGTSLSDAEAKDERTEDEKMITRLMGKAETAYYAGDYKKAITIWDSVIAISPDNYQALYNQESAHMKLNQYKEVKKAYNKAFNIEVAKIKLEYAKALLHKVGVISPVNIREPRKPFILGEHRLWLSQDRNLSDSIDYMKKLAYAYQKKIFPFEVTFAPSSPIILPYAAGILRGTQIALAAQNIIRANPFEFTDFTGGVTLQDLISLGVKYVITGYPNMRQYQRETNESVNQKLKQCLRYKVIPIVWVGESWEAREKGYSQEHILQDLKEIFADIHKSEFLINDIIIGYEPIWATRAPRWARECYAASPEYANHMISFIKDVLYSFYGEDSKKILVLYGGGVDNTNASSFLMQSQIDGLSIATRSVSVESFIRILYAVENWMELTNFEL